MKTKTQIITKRILFLCSFFFYLNSHAQAPNLMSYQAIIRNASNALVANQGVGMKISILQGTATGTEVYKELFNPNPTTNANGLVTLAIGTGTPLTGAFTSIDWSAGPYFIKTETDPTGGTNYTITSTTQLMSVPYALYAKTAGASNSWGLTGNTGTTAANFIGTTDDNDLQLKVNNQKAGVIETDDISTNTVHNANTGFGFLSLYSNTTGSYNDAFGLNALYSNTTGSYNVANGYSSLYSNTIGSNNIATGRGALFSNTEGNNNVANGYSSLYSNTTGYNNVANGEGALYYNTTGSGNVANGKWALVSNTTGFENVANGNLSMFDNTTGNHNVANGAYSLNYNKTGINNTAIGDHAGPGTNTNRNNTTCIGSGTGWITTADNSVNIGNFSVAWIGGQVAWGNYSDKRIKNNIKENVPGLAFISQLKPVTYNLDIHKQYELAMNGQKDTSADYPGKYDIEKITQTGFLAQDVEAAAKAINYDFSGVEAPKDGEGLYKLRYSEFVVPMVKAIQEQQAIIEAQNKKIIDLTTRILNLENK